MVVDLSNCEDMFEATQPSKSAVKLIKNSKGVNWEIKVVAGEEDLIQGLKAKALEVHKDLVNEIDYPLAE